MIKIIYKIRKNHGIMRKIIHEIVNTKLYFGYLLQFSNNKKKKTPKEELNFKMTQKLHH